MSKQKKVNIVGAARGAAANYGGGVGGEGGRWRGELEDV